MWMTFSGHPEKRAMTRCPAPWRVSHQLQQSHYNQLDTQNIPAPLDNPETVLTHAGKLCKTQPRLTRIAGQADHVNRSPGAALVHM